jgi:hypothetical protein
VPIAPESEDVVPEHLMRLLVEHLDFRHQPPSARAVRSPAAPVIAAERFPEAELGPAMGGCRGGFLDDFAGDELDGSARVAQPGEVVEGCGSALQRVTRRGAANARAVTRMSGEGAAFRL